MASEDTNAAPPAGGAASVTPPAAGRMLHRLMTAAAGLGVMALAGATFVLTYDDLRALALAGGAARQWAPVYPIMVDVLLTVIVVALVATRNARWWSRWPRWALLLAVLGGTAAAGVQRAVHGYESLPKEPLRAGVAVAPYVMLAIVVWLWLAMFRQLHRPPSDEAAPGAPAEPDARPAEVAETAEIAEAPPAERTAPQPARPDSAWLFDDEDDQGEPPTSRQAAGAAVGHMPSAAPPLELPERRPGFPEDTDPVFDSPEPPPSPRPALDRSVDDFESVFAADVDDDPTPPGGHPSPPPTDVELVRGGGRPGVKPAATTRPDIVMPDPKERAQATDPAQDVDEDVEPGEDRAEDPDGGDRVPFHDELIGEDRQVPPPSGSFRSSPTPPRD